MSQDLLTIDQTLARLAGDRGLLANLFRLRGTKDKFIHTEHTGAGSEAPGNNTGNRP